MRLKHFYQNLKKEFQEEIRDHILTEESEIWIVRETQPIVENYRYIHDWYYIDDLANEQEEENDKFRAVRTTVGRVLKELDEWIGIT